MTDILLILEQRSQERVQKLSEDWQEESAEQAAVYGNPKRSFYLDYMASQAPRLVQQARQAQEEKLRQEEEHRRVRQTGYRL